MPKAAKADAPVGIAGLIDKVNDLWNEARHLHKQSRDSSLDDSATRLAKLRAALDRLDGIRDELSWQIAHVREAAAVTREVQREAYINARPMGQSSEDRAVARDLASLGATKRANALERELAYILDAATAVGNIYRSCSDARIESLTLLRMQLRISADDYRSIDY